MNYFNIINLFGFQIGWWSCVLGVKNDLYYLGPIVMAIFLLLHYLFHPANVLIEFKLILIFSLIGTLADSILAFSNVLKYHGGYLTYFAPLWITAMWAGFTATINYSMGWLKRKLFLQIISGLVFGPLAYITGQKFDAIVFNISFINTCIIIAIIYGISLPLVYHLNTRMGLD
tara:strand:- start:8 stop:526 length:519 start_codon:yes stop_codon:yes gene_type:complete